MSHAPDYGGSMDKISASLHKLVQKADNRDQLETMIRNNKHMSEQCKIALLKPWRLKTLMEFKNTKNLSIMEFIKVNYMGANCSGCEICFLENIDLRSMRCKIIYGTRQ